MQTDAKVPFTQDNGMRCICGRCPVQAESKCATGKMEKMKEMMAGNPETAMIPEPEDVPGLYCSTGTAACKDLEFKQMCICDSCPIWAEYALPSADPMNYYCKEGKAR